MVIKVGVNGYGTIGRRVADAISLQADMKLMGVVKTKPDYKAEIAIKKGYQVYASNPEGLKTFEDAGVEASGTLEDLMKDLDILVDATPGKVGVQNKPLYQKNNLRAIFEGGEKDKVAEVSFVAQCNYDKAVGANYIRCVSCNTTGLCRTLHAVDQAFGVKRVIATVIRRGADPDDIKSGPIDAIVPDPTSLPSHHGPDVNTVLPNLHIDTMAVKVPSTFMHLHAISVTLAKPGTTEDVLKAFEDATRVIFVSKDDGLGSTAHLFDYAREMHRPRNDLYEICVWRESVKVVEGELFYFQAVHQESDVVPENIDAIRAALKAADAQKSIKTTNTTLKILK